MQSDRRAWYKMAWQPFPSKAYNALVTGLQAGAHIVHFKTSIIFAWHREDLRSMLIATCSRYDLSTTILSLLTTGSTNLFRTRSGATRATRTILEAQKPTSNAAAASAQVLTTFAEGRRSGSLRRVIDQSLYRFYLLPKAVVTA
jgi:hypothetical protein